MTPLNIKVVESSHEMFGYMRQPQLKTLQDNSLEADFGMIHNFKVTSPTLHRGAGKKSSAGEILSFIGFYRQQIFTQCGRC